MKILTGNDLETGDVVWWTGEFWSRHVGESIDVGDGGEALAAREEGARRVNAPYVVDAVGAWAKQVARLAGFEMPLVPMRHQLFITESLEGTRPENAMFRFVGELPNPHVDRYAELDLRFGWHVRRVLELSIVGNDLLHAQHVEFGSLMPPEAFPRSVYARTSWRF